MSVYSDDSFEGFKDNDPTLTSLTSDTSRMSISEGDQSRNPKDVEENESNSLINTSNALTQEELDISDEDNFSYVKRILEMCKPNLMKYLPRCKETFIINSSVMNLTDKQIEDLFQKEIGLRGIFSVALEQFRKVAKQILPKEDDEKPDKNTRPTTFKSFSNWKRKVRFCFQLNSRKFIWLYYVLSF